MAAARCLEGKPGVHPSSAAAVTPWLYRSRHMVPRCPECSGDLEPQEDRGEHTSAAGVRWWCDYCEIEFVQDGTGLLVEAD